MPQAGRADGNAGGDGGLARGVLPLRRGQHLAQDHFADFLARLDLGALQRRLDGDLAQLDAPARSRRRR